MSHPREITRSLFRALRSLIPGLPDNIESLQLNLSVREVPRISVSFHVREAKDGDPKGETTFEIRDSSERKTIEDLGITYGGRGPGGEYYTKQIDDLSCVAVWTESNDGEKFSADELEAIAADKRKRDQLAREPRISPS